MPALQRRLARGPRLIHWVARLPDVAAVARDWRAVGGDPGEVIAAERPTPGGLLRWKITVPADGRRRHGGALPTLIQWGDAHPADALPPSGVTLDALGVGGLPEHLAGLLGTRLPGLRIEASGAAPLSLELTTPRGRCALQAPSLEN